MNSVVKFLLALLTVVAVLECINAAVASERVTPTRNARNKCIKASDRINLNVGQTEFREGCSKVSCRTTDGLLYIDQESCGIAVAAQGCRRVENKNRNYPECCPQVTC